MAAPDPKLDGAAPPSDSENTGSAADGAAASVLDDEGQRVVARVGGDPIRLEDLLDWARENPLAFNTFGSQWGRNAVLHQLIKHALLSAAAEAAFAEDPDAKGLSEGALQARYQRRFLTPSPVVTEDELRAFYTQHQARFGIPPMVRTRELFFQKPAIGAAGDPRAQAWSVYEQLLAGASIEEFAAQYAPDQASRRAGGDRGFLSVNERPQLGELTETMAVGDISEPFELTTGFSIVQLLDWRSGVAAPFDAVRDDVERALMAEREGDLIADFLTAQAREVGVEILLPEYADAWPSLLPESTGTDSND
jgi:parvulin-like peptidyl-prolyl isomerase